MNSIQTKTDAQIQGFVDLATSQPIAPEYDGVTGEAWDVEESAVIDGAKAQFGYVFIQRQWSNDLLVVYPTREIADWAIEHCPLIDSLCEEDCLDAHSVDTDDLKRTSQLVELCDIVLAG